MKLILDTHAFLWWLAGDQSLSRKARAAISNADNVVFVSAASAWEIATKTRIGKLPQGAAVANDLPGCVVQQGFTSLAITLAHAARAGALPGPLRDPFDRMLIAQSLIEGCPLISNEQVFDGYGIVRVW
jgi:PIN domain nuclease of toxin-antitoxin system